MRKWSDLPDYMKVDEVKPYYDVLNNKRLSLLLKRLFDITLSLVLLVLLSPVFIVISIAIKIDSKGPVFFRQIRYTTYGKTFRIHKFRTMVNNAESKGSLVTVGNDSRITNVGKLIRKCRIDEIAQLIDVLKGDMTFVGVRPEVKKYVDQYTNEMRATFLLPAGITNLTCIYFKDEDELLKDSKNPDEKYINEILPVKMKWNLKGIKDFGIVNDIKLLFMTLFAVLGKEYK